MVCHTAATAAALAVAAAVGEKEEDDDGGLVRQKPRNVFGKGGKDEDMATVE